MPRPRKPLHITIEQLRSLIAYDPATGLLTRLVACGGYEVGDIAGSTRPGNGYVYVQVAGVTYLAHRLAWAIHYGVWPEHDIDHRNRVRSQNWIDNLKPADQAINTANSGKTNKSGFRGVMFAPRYSRYRARITIHGRQIHLGYYTTAVDAAKVYDAAVIEHYGSDFPTNANLGKFQ